MSKGSSGYFSGTSGEGKALIQEVQQKGLKITPDEVIGITKDKTRCQIKLPRLLLMAVALRMLPSIK